MTQWDARGSGAGQQGWPAHGYPGAPAAHGPPQAPYGPPQGPYGPPPGHPGTGYPPPYGYGYVPRRTNGFAVASMVLGIVWVYWIGSVLALVFGYVARSQIRERGEAGDGMAIAGIVLGWIGVGFFGLVLLAGIAAGS
ncbi:hypothetical protein JOD57_002390 [Geodermatophilus bullaregiensis]|uniref:DUF4190 domain-containing protein n=1 Tax=Geodermatophilus bullaregiensis TaxID=1564160 RepID=UPI00195DC7D8|nr:DUF4190 domain-containing protein [Geodermatophilus bullaregiensis]MBM7806553.1 hypothetical protein [Geodermatophilus bullaregiensis]